MGPEETTLQDQSGHNSEQYIVAKRVALVGTVGDTFLTLSKLSIGILGNSAALIAEGIHSGADLIFDVVVLIGMRMARAKPDESHPYGHGRFESLATLILALLLLLVAFEIGVQAVAKVQAPDLEAPAMMTLVMAGLSMVIKELLYHYTVRAGRRVGSKITIANAWHHRADSIASFAALIGIAGAILGWPLLDPVAAIGVAFFVAKAGVEIAHTALLDLTEASSAVDNEVRDTLNRLIYEHSDIRSAHMLRARRLGPDVMVDVHVVVNPFLSASEGHIIADSLELAILREVNEVTSVIVHIDVEADDKVDRNSNREPPLSRQELQQLLVKQEPLPQPLVTLHHVVPHYSRDGITADLFFTAQPHATVDEVKTMAKGFGYRTVQHYRDRQTGCRAVNLHLFLGEIGTQDKA
ncbi:MAG: cation transporter [Magnetococcales bacterium]|nr:cation transporter [Magnetococcales bacterium]